MKKRFSRFASLFLAVGLSMSMVTACGSKSDDDDKEDKKEKKEETVTPEKEAEEFASSDEIKDITFNGTSIKVIADISGSAAGQDLDVSANAVMDLRSDPFVMRMTANAEYQGNKKDIELYTFAGDDGKYYVEVKDESGKYLKSEMPEEYASQMAGYVPSLNTTLFNDDVMKQVEEKLKSTEALGKKSVDGKEFDAFEIKLSEERISEVINTYLPAIAAQVGGKTGLTQDQIAAYTSQLPKGYKEVPVDFYFDNGVPSGISIDLSNVLATLAGEESDAEAKCVLTILASYGDTSDITVPDAEIADDSKSLLE